MSGAYGRALGVATAIVALDCLAPGLIEAHRIERTGFHASHATITTILIHDEHVGWSHNYG